MKRFLSVILSMLMLVSALSAATAYAVEDESNVTVRFFKPEGWEKVGVISYASGSSSETEVTETEPGFEEIYVAEVPASTQLVCFFRFGDEVSTATSNLKVKAGDAPRIFVENPYSTFSNGGLTLNGAWMNYYGDGKYGSYATLEEAEKNNAVYSGGKFPKPSDVEDNSAKTSKKSNPVTASAKAKAVKASKLKRAKVSVKNAIVVKKAKGAVAYKKLSGSKKLSISKNGVITVKKGMYKKNTVLKIKVKITAKGNAKYKSGSQTVTAKIKIR